MGEGAIDNAPIPRHLADRNHAGRTTNAANSQVVVPHRPD